MSRNAQSELPFAQRERLRFVESTLLWEGTLTRSRVHEVFGVSPNHVTTDLRWYEDQFPKSLVFESRQRRYVAGPRFRPRFASDDPAEYLALQLAYAQCGSSAVVPLLGGGEAVPTESLPSPAHGVDKTVLQLVVQAIRHRTGIELVYHSMRAETPGTRSLWPHALVHSGVRWYARAFDSRRETFRNFALQRMDALKPLARLSPKPPDDDEEWVATTMLTIVPHPALNAHQRGVVAREFGMREVDGVMAWTVTLRNALIGYFARRYGLDATNPAPPQHRIVLSDGESARRWFLPDGATAHVDT
jgi:hypothetical protein